MKTYGQYILFGFLSTSLEGQLDKPLSQMQLHDIMNLVVELTSVDLYGSPDECPDVRIMVEPQNAFNIFCDWYDENEEIIKGNLVD
jgi:hypothetical protein